MTPPARAQAAIELLDMVIAAARDAGAAADTIARQYFRERRYAGAKDRRAVRELLYAAIRRAGERPATGRAALLGLAREDAVLTACFDGSAHGPAAIGPAEAAAEPGVAPAWLTALLGHLDPDEQAALVGRAPLDLRANRLKASRDDVLALFPEGAPTPHARDGLRLPEGTPAERHPAFLAGLFEVQDEGSQLVAAACRAAPGMTVVDLCAGGGGKTLALAAVMAGAGRLIACDADRARLSRLMPRAGRAGATVETRLLDPGREDAMLDDLASASDVVLVDAPCSGTGTWRRNPEARWRLTPARLDRLLALQARLLDVAATLVRPGGALVHAVCSLLDGEGAGQTAAFLSRHPGWQAGELPFAAGRARGPGRLLTPARDGTDGFFVARLTRPC